MLSSGTDNPLLKQIISRLYSQDKDKSNNTHANKNSGKKDFALQPSQLLVIAGLLGGVLEVTSILVDKDQTVELVLTGSLKEKTELEKLMDQLGTMPFDDVMKAFLGRLI